MDKLTSILAVIDPSGEPVQVLEKAVALAHDFGARIELFLCDAERAYALEHAYEPSGIEESRRACLADGRRYLEGLRQCVSAPGIDIAVEAACESPFYAGVAHKALRSRPDLVIKAASGRHPLQRYALDVNDWELARSCPASLLLLRGRPWPAQLRMAAAVDVSVQETAGLARAILHAAEYLSLGCRAQLEVIYSDRQGADVDEHRHRIEDLQQLACEFKVPAERVHVLQGEPEATLPAFSADRHYDILALGALTHRTGPVALIGTLTSRLVDALDCDFLLIKPASYRCPLAD